jgi:fructose-1,6-bisphosphatase/inositol monophosphatase family enzyme
MVFSLDTLSTVALAALRKSYQVHQNLGAAGEQLTKTNTYGETALKMDIEAEQAVIETLGKARVPIRIISEEHGTIDLSNNPRYLGILDGLDGSEVYKKERGKGRYGTMFGIFSGLDPTYGDYLFSGVMEHSTRRLFYAMKGRGSFVVQDGRAREIRCSDSKKLNEDTRIYVDASFDINKQTFLERLRGFEVNVLGSSAAYYVDLAEGKAELVLECTRKGNLEIAVSFGLVRESGGRIVDMNGRSLTERKYLVFGQRRHLPIISTATSEVAAALIEHIK